MPSPTSTLLLAFVLLTAPAAVAEESPRLAATSAQALDHLLKARQALDENRAFEAGQALVRARVLLARARTENPEGRIHAGIDHALLALLDEPVDRAEAKRRVERLLATVRASGLPEEPGYSRRYAERARYHLLRGDRAEAVRELSAAAARLPVPPVDDHLAACIDQVGRALAAIHARELTEARSLVAAAERGAFGVVRVANGLAESELGDVSAAPPGAATESEIGPARAFQPPSEPPRER